MICPHCGKETEGYVGITSQNLVQPNLNNGCAGGVLTTWVTSVNVNAAAANPVVASPNALNAAGCANQSLDIHYHTF